MLFKDNLGRIAMRAASGLAAAGALAALASCGGGTYQVTAFVPARILTFGDESSRLEGTQGLKYSINGISDATLQIDCNVAPIWTQTLATSYGLVYANCNQNASADTNAIDLTTVNATVDDVVQKVDAFKAGDTFNSNDLVTIWVGMHDVINEYQANGTGDETELLADMKTQGAALGATVNAITAAGARVILLTIPDMSYTPFAFTESQRGDFDRLKLLSDMSTQFNLGLRSNIVNDGSKIGLVLVDDIVRGAVRNPGGSGLIASPNATYGCLNLDLPPNCSSNTLSTDPSRNSSADTIWLWADPTHLGSWAQDQIGNQAQGRSHSNPF